jgi:hypothetical protein
MNTQRQSDHFDRQPDGESQCSLPGCSVALEFTHVVRDAAAPCHPPCSVAAPRLRIVHDLAEARAMRDEVIPGTPDDAGGNLALNRGSHCIPTYCGPPHCGPNSAPVAARRPTRQDLVQWLNMERRA